MQICPKCESIIRNGQRVRALLIATFLRDELDSHILRGEEELWVEHEVCYPEPFEVRVERWIRRKLKRWLSTFGI